MPAKWQLWMPVYIDRFLGSTDVQMMEPAAFKGYFCLLLAAWQTDDCTLPIDDGELARHSRLGRKTWLKNKAEIMRKFTPVAVTVGGTVTEKLRNGVEFELWIEAKRVFEKRRDAAGRTNNMRYAPRSPIEAETVTEDLVPRSADTRTTVVHVPVSVPVSVSSSPDQTAPDTVDTRILAESVGIFGMREQADMNRLLAVYVKDSGKRVNDAIQHMINRWVEYQQAMPMLEWTYGSSYKFFLSGNWDQPGTWPKIGAKPSARQVRNEAWKADIE